MRVAVFASGNGSNFAQLVQSFHQHEQVEIALLICDRAGAYVLQRAAALGIPAYQLHPKEFGGNKAAYEEAIVQLLQAKQVDWIVLAGYMRLVGPTLLQHYSQRIINLHPSLLPSFPGKDAIEQAYTYGVKVTGVTVHLVDAGMDTGPILMQEAVPVEDEDTLEELATKIHAVEHRILPAAIERLATGTLVRQGRRLTIKQLESKKGENRLK